MALDLVRDAWRCLGWRLVALALLMLLAGVFEGIGLSMLFPVLARFGIGQTGGGGLQEWMDRVLAALHVPNELGILLALAVGLLVLQVVFQTAKGWAEADCQTRYTEDWQRRIFAAFIDAEWRFFTQGTASARVNAIVNEASRVNSAFYLYAQMAAAAVFIAVYAAISLAASWQLVLFLVVFGGLAWLAVRPLSRRGGAIGERVRQVNEGVQHRAGEFLHSAKLIKATASEELAKSLFAGAARDFRTTYRAAAFHPKLVFGLYMIAGYVLLGVGLWAAVAQLGLDPATVLVSVYVFLRLYVQFTNLQQFRQGFLLSIPAFASLGAEVAAARRLGETLHQGRTLPAGPATIALADVTVRYGGAAALDGLSLNVASGAVLGITGPSGAGKSTLVDVVVGLVTPDEGAVLIDGVPIVELALADWRRSIGYVGQETILLDGSIAGNIAWGSDADRGAIERAARAAHIHDFIAGLPSGYDTAVGDRGVRLSGGQRQRLGLARALIGEKRLLILDEATSALDSESEQAIGRALEALRGKVTILMVAHRLSTLALADRVLVLEAGRVAEAGSWDELRRRDGAFARLWKLQQGAVEA